jgi:hypothetical protein
MAWTAAALTSGAPASVTLFVGLPFVVAGLYASVGRLVVAWIVQTRTWYVLTSRRVLVVTGVTSPRTRSLALADLPPLTTTTRAGGRGTIVIGSGLSRGGRDLSRWLIWGTPASVSQPDAGAVLANIENAQAVAEAILQAKEHARAGMIGDG